MKILHTIFSMGLRAGGPTLSTYLTVKGLRKLSINVDILTYYPKDKSDKLISSENFIRTLPLVTNSFYYSVRYKKNLLQTPYDLYHIQGIWLYPTYITPRVAGELKKPYMISPRGSLYPQDLRKSYVKKKIFLELFLRNDLQKAACIHTTCTEEMMHIRNLGITSPIAVIPNPIEVPESMITPSYPKDKLRVGYLGRIHRRKKIEKIIYAWAELGNQVDDCELVIIGSEDVGYMDFLQKEVRRLNLRNVVFTGFLTGKEKDDAINSLSCLVVPSDFENFGMIVPEALIRGIPVIASKGTPWEELDTHQCGWWINNDVETIAATIKKALSLSDEERIQMGLNGQQLMKNNYSTEIVAKKMEALYEWILTGNKCPDFVFLGKS